MSKQYMVVSEEIGKALCQLSRQPDDPLYVPETFSKNGVRFTLVVHAPNDASVRFRDNFGYGYFLWRADSPCEEIISELLEKKYIQPIPEPS